MGFRKTIALLALTSTLLKRLQIPNLGVALDPSKQKTPHCKITLALFTYKQTELHLDLQSAREDLAKRRDIPATYVLESRQIGVNLITVNVMNAFGWDASLSSSRWSALMPPIKHRPTSSASGVFKSVSPTPCLSFASTPTIGMHVTGASLAVPHGIDPVSSSPIGTV